MESLEFYDHGTPFHYAKDIENVISTVHILYGCATVSKGESKLHLTLQVFVGARQTFEFELKGDRYFDIEYIDLEDLLFFASNEEYVLYQGSEQLAHKSWPSKVTTLKISQGLSLAICYEDGTIVTCSLHPRNGNLLNPFQADPGVDEENPRVPSPSPQVSTYQKPRRRDSAASDPASERRPTIAWAAEDAFFVINMPKNDTRILIVFSKTGQLLQKSIQGMFPGLEKPIDIDSENACIACILSESGFDQKLVVIEKNLSIIHSFKLEDGAKVQKLLWSNCSEVIAVWQKSKNKSWLDLYVKNNSEYLWKQRLPIGKAEELVNFKFAFSMENSFIIQMIFKNYLFQYSFLKKIIKTNTFGNEITSTCDIRGREADLYMYGKSRLPNFRKTHIIVPSNAHISTIVYDTFRQKFAVVNIEYNVAIYKFTDASSTLIAEFSLDTSGALLPLVPLTYYRFFFDPDGNFCAIRIGNTKDFTSDTLYHFGEPTYALLKTGISNTRIIKGQCIIYRTDNIDEDEIKYRLVPSHSALILDYNIFKFKYEYSITRFCVGSIDVNCVSLKGLFTSLHFTDTHILLTCHRQHGDPLTDCLITLELNEPNLQYLILGSGTIFDLAYTTQIEKGATVLNHIPKTTLIILRLPKGRKKYMHLRNVSLKKLHQVLMARDFEGACSVIKTEALELNLLVDLDPHFFKRNLREIVMCLHDNSALYKFLIELSDSSKLTAEDKKLFNSHPMKNKRFEVCNMVINLILSFENRKDYLSEVTIAGLCCQSEGFNSSKAVEVISSVIGSDINEHKSKVIRAVKYLSPYITYEVQYLAALEVNNLDLAELVAEISGMDHRKYRPFLAKLKTLSELDRKQSISKYLGRKRDTVMYYLDRYEEGEVSYNELLIFANQHNCFDLYYRELIRNGSAPQEIAIKYAAQLDKEEKYKEAGLVITGINMHRQACLMFMKGLFWEEAISSLFKITDMSPEERKQEFILIATQLELAKRFKESAVIYSNFCDDQQAATIRYMKGMHFKEAYLSLLNQNLEPEITQLLIPNLKQTMQSKCTHLRQMQLYYTATLDRLKMAREKIMTVESDEATTEDYLSPAGSVTTEDQDYFSVASSVRTTDQDNESVAGSVRTTEPDFYSAAGSSTAMTEQDYFSAAGTVATQSTSQASPKASPKKKMSKEELMRHFHTVVEDVFKIIDTLEEQASLLDLASNRGEQPYINFIMGYVHDFKKKMEDTADEIWPPVLKRFDVKTPEEAAFVNVSRLNLKYRGKPVQLTKLNTKAKK